MKVPQTPPSAHGALRKAEQARNALMTVLQVRTSARPTVVRNLLTTEVDAATVSSFSDYECLVLTGANRICSVFTYGTVVDVLYLFCL